MKGCPEEANIQHPRSPGLVADWEIVCRGAYDPIHFNRRGDIKPALVRPADLIAGQLSVWRQSRDPGFGTEGVRQELESRGNTAHRPRFILAATAARIRGLRLDEFGGDQRIFCVLDNCATGKDGGWHPEHATIKLDDVDGVAWSVDSHPFLAAKEGLVALLKSRVLWASGG